MRQDHDGLRSYAHCSTGNYHPETARIYCEIGLISVDSALTHEASQLFNYLTTGCGAGHTYRKLLLAATRLKPALLRRIERERQFGSDGLVPIKTNALEEADITRALYGPAQAGLQLDPIVRDTFRLRPRLPGISDNIRVVRIVGSFLEHARICYFRNRGAEEYFIGSADAMKRNLESRGEVLVPIEDATSRMNMRAIADLQLRPNRNAWEMQPDGT